MKIIDAVVRKIIEIPMWTYFKVFHRIKIEGKENIPQEQVIFCANHRSFADAPIVDTTCGRKAYYLAKQEIIKNKFIAYLAKVFKVIVVKRDSKDISALKNTLSVLKKGESVVIFPEGTRNGMQKGESAKDGAAFFTIKSGVPVVPVGIISKKGIFSKYKIKYGKPIHFTQYTDPKDREQKDAVTKIIMDEIIKLSSNQKEN